MAGRVTHDPGYTIDADTTLDLLTVKPTGLWDLATLERYGVAYDRAVEDYRGRPYRLLVDLRGFSVQSKELHAAAQLFVARRNPQRTALILSGSVLQRLQAQRTAAFDDEMHVFSADEIAAARRWVLEPIPVRRSAHA